MPWRRLCRKSKVWHCLIATCDPDHHRTVFTIAGFPDVTDAGGLLSLCVLAQQLIDLTEHQGVHPRVGAVDVVPFIPLQRYDSWMIVVSWLKRLGASRLARRTADSCFSLWRSFWSFACKRQLETIRQGGWRLGCCNECNPQIQNGNLTLAKLNFTQTAGAVMHRGTRLFDCL